MVQAVIFDVDNTLYSYDRAHAPAFARLKEYAARELGIGPERFEQLHGQADRILRARLGQPCGALHNRLLRYQILLEEVGAPLEPHALAMARLYWDTLLGAMEPSPGIADCLPRLKAAGYRVGIGTDMTVDYQMEKLSRLGLLRWVDFVVTSEEVLAEKPDAKLFLCCAQKAKASPAHCLYIGDNLKKDIEGAHAAGMHALWYQPDARRAAEKPDIASIQTFAGLERRLSEM